MDLKLCGFVANVKKSQWHLSQVGSHLGFLVDLKNGIFTLPESRVDKLKDLLRQLHGKTNTTARFLARVVGTIISMGLGIGPVSRMWTRLYTNVNQASAWDRPLTLAPDTLKELEFWENWFEKFNGQPIWTVNPICSVISSSDFSEYGWGGYTVNIFGLSAKGNFSVGEARMDSSWREVKGTFNVLCSFVKSIKGRKVRHRTDNQNVVRALTNGNKKQHLQALTMDINF